MAEKKGSLTDRKYAIGLIRLFNDCYKTGLRDAESVYDKIMCDELKEEVSEPGVYGFVTKPYRMEQKEWRLHLMLINGTNSRNKNVDNYLSYLTPNSGYFLCVLPIAQDFYVQGLDDFNKNPTLIDLSIIDNNKLIRWTRKGIVDRSMTEIIIQIQDFCFNRKRTAKESESKKSIKSVYYDWFSEEIWANIQKTKL